MASIQVDTSCDGKLYKHQPLDLRKHQIRLLKMRNPIEHTLEYHLVTFDFESAPSYVALSYTWGEEQPTGIVSIDGKEFEIRINLYNFLKTYATEGYLWVDQICIDQSNPNEQSHQVSMMWKIYSQCAFVLVWLRDESTCTPSTQQAALDFNNGVQSYPKNSHYENDSNVDQMFPEWPMLALLHNSYFDRLWIVQEWLLSKNIRILVEGNVWVSWESMRTKNDELWDQIRKTLPSTGWMISAKDFRVRFYGYAYVNVSCYITTTVGQLCGKKCRDPRDKVYGLMALIQPSSRVEIDYTKPVHQVFLDSIASMIREYLQMRDDMFNRGYKLNRVVWPFAKSLESSWNLAQAMSFTYYETRGLRSFVECLWERVLWYELTTKSAGGKVDAESHCITSVGFELETPQLSIDGRLSATCNRWWYDFEGKRYYHDCKEWSGKAKLREYTGSCQDLRVSESEH